MKKIILSIIFAIMMSFCANAQVDNIIDDWSESPRSLIDDMPWLPAVAVGSIYNDIPAQNGPIGDGLLILTVLGTGYVFHKKKMKNNK